MLRATRSSRSACASPSRPNPAYTVSSVVVDRPFLEPELGADPVVAVGDRALRRPGDGPAAEVGLERGLRHHRAVDRHRDVVEEDTRMPWVDQSLT